MDTIGDFLTIIRNAYAAQKENCSAQWSKLREGIAQNLKDEGFIRGYEVFQDQTGKKKYIKVDLKYHRGTAAITEIKRKSKPGCRSYVGYDEIPKVLGGMGTSVLSTSGGIKTHKAAKKEKLGGELLFTVY